MGVVGVFEHDSNFSRQIVDYTWCILLSRSRTIRVSNKQWASVRIINWGVIINEERWQNRRIWSENGQKLLVFERIWTDHKDMSLPIQKEQALVSRLLG